MERHETFSEGEKLLAGILDECLDEDLSFVPPEREIARTHRFSESFERAMEELLETGQDMEREQKIRRHFSPRYGQWAACILVFCVCGWLFYQVGSSIVGSGADKSAELESAAEDTMEEPAEAEEEASAPTDVNDAAGSADAGAPSGGAGAEEPSESGGQDGWPYCGMTIYPSGRQEVPERLSNVTTLVNCPVLDEENPVLFLTIGNTGEEDIVYRNQYELEVQFDGVWYRIPWESGEEEQWLTLEAGMAVDEEIDLSGYPIDYDAGQYRLITHVEQELVSAEFTFGEAFTEKMEQLEK